MDKTTKHVLYIGLGSAAILLVPLIAMQFTDQVKWELNDFAFAFVFFVILGLILELGVRRLSSQTLRWTVGTAVVLFFMAVWAELAVGIL